jgi:hypothetical protein
MTYRNLIEIMHMTLFHSQLSLTEPQLLGHISSKHIRRFCFHKDMNTKTPLPHVNSNMRKRRGSHVHPMTSEEDLFLTHGNYMDMDIEYDADASCLPQKLVSSSMSCVIREA